MNTLPAGEPYLLFQSLSINHRLAEIPRYLSEDMIISNQFDVSAYRVTVHRPLLSVRSWDDCNRFDIIAPINSAFIRPIKGN